MSRRKQAKPIRLQDDGNPSLNGKNIFYSIKAAYLNILKIQNIKS